MKKIILLAHCPDKPGIVARITNFILERQGNALNLEQYVDAKDNIFFMRLVCEFENKPEILNNIKVQFQSIASDLQMQWQLYDPNKKPKMALFVSKYSHCLYDILGRFSSGDLPIEIPIIISNHTDMEVVANRFEIPFACIPVSKANKAEAEEKQQALLQEYKIDFIVLARYMQILSKDFTEKFPNQIINIHHSFLPAFPGAKPYHSAHRKGVKIIGATSHYVTSDLDEGPIIEQDIVKVSHNNSISDFIAKGKDVEKIVLSRAIKHHVNRKILVYKNKTIIFD